MNGWIFLGCPQFTTDACLSSISLPISRSTVGDFLIQPQRFLLFFPCFEPLHEIIFSDSKNSQMANEKQKLRLKTKMLDSNYFNCLIELSTMFRMLANCFKFQVQLLWLNRTNIDLPNLFMNRPWIQSDIQKQFKVNSCLQSQLTTATSFGFMIKLQHLTPSHFLTRLDISQFDWNSS